MAFPLRVSALLAALLVAVPALSGCVLPGTDEWQNRRSGPGDNALDYIRGAPYSKLKIVVDYVDGHGPNLEALEVLKATAAEVLDKKEVEVVRHGDIPAKGKDHRYSFEEVDEIERAHRTEYSDGDTAVMYFLYLDGQSDRDSDKGSVLGAAYHGSSVVMFKNTLRKAVQANKGFFSGVLGPSDQEIETIVERAVLVHEMGHILGLVNNGIPMVKDHEDKDPSHTPKHSTNKNSVMYWAVENSAGLSSFLSGNTNLPYRFDADDKADIEAAKKGG